jgi:hypothetical protein
MAGGDQQERYRQMGYRIAGGAVEFYYVVFRTHKHTQQQEICLNGLFAWSNDLHDPARTIQRLAEQDANYRYSRLGPLPTRAQAEQQAITFALQIFGDATRYGIWGTGGLTELEDSDYREPRCKQRHGQLHHVLGLGDHDRLPFEAAKPMPLAAVLPLDPSVRAWLMTSFSGGITAAYTGQ